MNIIKHAYSRFLQSITAKLYARHGLNENSLFNDTHASNSWPALPIIQCNDRPLFPHFKAKEIIKNVDLIHLIQHQVDLKTPFVGVFLKKNGNNNPDLLVEHRSELWNVGCLAHVQEVPNNPGEIRLLLSGLDRITLQEPLESPSKSILMAKVEKLRVPRYDEDQYFDALTLEIVKTIRDIIEMDPEALSIFLTGIRENKENYRNAEFLCDLAAIISKTDREQLQAVMEEPDIHARMKFSLELMKIEIARLELQKKMIQSTQHKIEDMQNKMFLTEQMKIIKKEIGFKNDKASIIEKYLNIIENKPFPLEILHCIKDEIKKLKNLEVSTSEFGIVKTYLDWMTVLPWLKKSEENLNIDIAKSTLDANHFGMDDVKLRILEFIAIANLKGSTRGKIICLHGSPGVGKTSIAKSIAKALHRKFYRINVGGMNNVSELKGHRRTYVGALPGKIVQSLKVTGTLNPVILIDEIDKIGISTRGFLENPSAALLEILDPEQNSNFLDYYLDVPLDLSGILFICTANELHNIAEPLLDRMEVIHLTGYTSEEKFTIAKDYLLPNIMKETGLTSRELNFRDCGINSIVNMYCREAGVRKLQNQLEKITRKVALQICSGVRKLTEVSSSNIEDYLGHSQFDVFTTDGNPPPGVVTGLAFTSNGGEILFIETAKKGSQAIENSSRDTYLELTGQLGPVMQDSAEIALTFARNFIQTIDPANSILEKNQIHLHVPKTFQPKEGPSAGITITTALISLALNRPVRSNIAMTGALSLRGHVLPVGGIKEKVIAAKRNGIKRLILAEGNRVDFEDISESITNEIQVSFVSNFNEVFNIVFRE